MSALYKVKEAFYTLQGEGAQSGRPAVFCRFSKCNLWNGKESGREAAVCKFCDTDFIGTDGQNGGSYSARELISLLTSLWPDMSQGKPYVVCTGGEPALQLDETLVQQLHQAGFEIAVETNGTLPLPAGIDWICLSPKGTSNIVLQRCNELKLVFPQPDNQPDDFLNIEADHRYLQPIDEQAVRTTADSTSLIQLFQLDQQQASPTAQTVAYCLANPVWKISLQTHKWMGID
ncbi:7-carboxy-7-deazaguanine synthase [Oceanobacter mangrovi]|uniref:7-carboxy-7-deazaguanine synthase n=1 Tax=Oceanobacter mangrovi TaxID=2862510 RepID=UPI001C8EFCBD|nr:7-carboxy-7-deazaguanine synthase [Oceanobacter mangrovi]